MHQINQPNRFNQGMNPKEWIEQYELYTATINLNSHQTLILFFPFKFTPINNFYYF